MLIVLWFSSAVNMSDEKDAEIFAANIGYGVLKDKKFLRGLCKRANHVQSREYGNFTKLLQMLAKA
jgi:hypothetical protein